MSTLRGTKKNLWRALSEQADRVKLGRIKRMIYFMIQLLDIFTKIDAFPLEIGENNYVYG
jgi:hypothetical protein